MTRELTTRELRVRAVAARSSGLVRRPRLVRQLNDRTCVHACLSMVTGVPIEEIIWALGDRQLADEHIFGFLGLCGITAWHIGPGRFPAKGPVYLGTVPSLNHEFGAHQVISFTTDDGSRALRDPNQGRPGKRVMTVRRWFGNRPTVYEWIELAQPTFWFPNDPTREVGQ